MPYYISPPPMNPLSRLLAAILAVLAMVGAFFFGVFVLAFAAGIGLIAWLAFSVRLWWLRKKGAIGGAGPNRAARVRSGTRVKPGGTSLTWNILW